MNLHEDEIFVRGPDDLAVARERRTYAAMERERAQREARRRLDAETRGPVLQPVIETLRQQLARPRLTTTWRLGHWQPTHSRVMLAAQFKAGKSTLVGNVLRSLVDGDDWLGQEPVTPISGTVVLLDLEMGAGQLTDWLGAQRITADDRVVVVPLRGRAASFDIADPDIRAEWVARLRQHRSAYLVLDCLRPILDALGLDEHREAGRFLTAFDALLTEAGIGESLVVHHMGHLNERARGDSRLRDWPDVEWRLVRQDDNPASVRYLSAYGRDVDVPESQLAYAPLTRALTLVGGSRADAKTTATLAAVIKVLTAKGTPLSGRQIKDALAASHPRDTVDAALGMGKLSGGLLVEPGPRNANLYSVAESQCPAPSGECPPDTQSGGVSECPAAYIEPDTQDTPTRPPSIAYRGVSGPDTGMGINGQRIEPPRFGINPEAWARHHLHRPQ